MCNLSHQGVDPAATGDELVDVLEVVSPGGLEVWALELLCMLYVLVLSFTGWMSFTESLFLSVTQFLYLSLKCEVHIP